MRLATFNVNSIRSRIDRVEAFLARHEIDVIALQETKARDDQWPLMGLEALGYEVATLGYNQWNGVAIASRVGLSDVRQGFDGQPQWGEPLTSEARALGATCGEVQVWSLYVPNGRAVGDPHLEYKLAWLGALRDAAAGVARGLCRRAGGADRGLEHRAHRRGRVGHGGLREEHPRHAGRAGGVRRHRADGVRRPGPPAHAGARAFTYWDYYRNRFERNHGMRIDFVLGSPALQARVTSAAIDRDERAGKGASDHAPVIVDIAD